MALTKEDLLAISQLLDEKLGSKLDEKLDSRLDKGFAEMEARMDEKLDKRFAEMETRVDEKLDRRFAEMEARMDARFRPIEGRLKKVELLLEHDVLPRLQTIEDCYIKTYKRYQNAADQFDRMSADIDVLKTIVSRHSEKLNPSA